MTKKCKSACKKLKSDINEKIVDLTNIPNQYQDTIRYGMLMPNDLKDRIISDLGNANVNKSIVITHLNEYGVDQNKLKKIFNEFDIYVSDGMTHNDVYILWIEGFKRKFSINERKIKIWEKKEKLLGKKF